MYNLEFGPRGVPVLNPKDFAVNRDVRQNVESAKDWQYQETAKTLYRWADRFMERFIRPIELPGPAPPCPNPCLSFDRFDHRVYAFFRDSRNPQGLLYEITMNTLHLEPPLWYQLETLLHEIVHLKQQNFGRTPMKNNYHNKEFVEMCEGLGLHPALGPGWHARMATEPFSVLMKEYGVQRPEPDGRVAVAKPERGDYWENPDRREGKSTLAKWQCPCGQIVRVAERMAGGGV